MDALAVMLIGAGAFMMYEAYKSKTPTPVATTKAAISSGKLQPTTP